MEVKNDRDVQVAKEKAAKYLLESNFTISISVTPNGAGICIVGNPAALLDELIKGDLKGDHDLLRNLNEIRDLIGQIINDHLDIVNSNFMKGFKRFKEARDNGLPIQHEPNIREMLNELADVLHEAEKRRDEARND